MSETINTNNLVERFGNYVEKGAVKKTSETVSDQFRKRLDELDAEAPPKEGRSRRSRARGARRYQPPKIAKLRERHGKQKSDAPKRHIAPRRISMKHAKRLARYAPLIEGAAKKYNVPVELIC